MGLCTTALIDEVLCEDAVILTRLDQNVSIGNISIPLGSELSGQTLISVLDCTPTVQDGVLGIQISLFVQEELLITTPLNTRFPLEFGFRFQAFAPLGNCDQVMSLKDILDELDCRIVSLSGCNQLTLHGDQTFDQFLTITLQVKLLRESQLRIALCPPFSVPCRKVAPK